MRSACNRRGWRDPLDVVTALPQRSPRHARSCAAMARIADSLGESVEPKAHLYSTCIRWYTIDQYKRRSTNSRSFTSISWLSVSHMHGMAWHYHYGRANWVIDPLHEARTRLVRLTLPSKSRNVRDRHARRNREPPACVRASQCTNLTPIDDRIGFEIK
jgi:hypothetical protein